MEANRGGGAEFSYPVPAPDENERENHDSHVLHGQARRGGRAGEVALNADTRNPPDVGIVHEPIEACYLRNAAISLSESIVRADYFPEFVRINTP